MMKAYSLPAVTTAALLSVISIGPVTESQAADQTVPTITETPREFFTRADFDADGRLDIVIVDKETGKYRLGYLAEGGMFNWVDCRPSGIKGLTGFTVGKLFPNKPESLGFTSPDANAIAMVDASSPTSPPRPLNIQFSAGLGPTTVVAVDVGGAGNNAAVMDLYVGSIYNSPDANLATLLRNDGKELPKTGESILPGTTAKGNRVALKAGGPEMVCLLVSEDNGDTLRAEDVSSGKAVTAASIPGLPTGGDYTVGNFRSADSREFLIYKPGQNTVNVRPIEDAGGKPAFGKASSFDLGKPVRRLVVLSQGNTRKLFVIYGEGETGALCNFDGVKAPTVVQEFSATNDLFTFAAALPEGFVVFTQAKDGKFSTKYQVYKNSGDKYVAGAFGSLPSLADNDNITIPDIHARIVANSKEAQQSDMKPYTNTIPGTAISYRMVVIPGGEFSMGSPDSEPNHQKDESPQHKVKIEPFWMGQCEVTWNEYELFMYPDEERRMRGTNPTDASGDKLADAVTHPSKPYVEMSFGMGKDGYPAISMTHHAANKYCQWLSAKTGQFYRLPTEAEWEYAARAGTTTPYFWGDDGSKLGEYAWYEQNSDFKYQKVGKKKANPWGLYDVYGNVTEWTLDGYDPEFYAKCSSSGTVIEPWNKATKPYPHSVRGGSWDDEAKMCRSAARRGSERAWKMTDPQLPKSIWFLSDAQWVGFRIVRPLKVPPPEMLQKYWTSGTERD